MPQGSFGRITQKNDFTALVPFTQATTTVPAALGENLGEGWSLHGVNEGVVTSVVDEPGGIIEIVTDTADNDNNFITNGVWRPADGGLICEFRLKIPTSVAATRAAVWCGISETMSIATPVMPFETDTVTTTYNGSGGMIGFGFDSDATVIDWRFGAGDGGAALGTVDSNGTVGTALGIRANANITADRWWVFRIEVRTDGTALGYIGDAVNDEAGSLRLVGESTGAVTPGDNFHATVGIENRSGANEELQVDYAVVQAYRNWDAD